MQNFESIEDAHRIASRILAGTIDPNLGCGLIAAIGEKLGCPETLAAFLLLGHEQYGHEQVGITAGSCVADILEACRELLATRT